MISKIHAKAEKLNRFSKRRHLSQKRATKENYQTLIRL